MKKKTKIIISSTAILSIASIVIGCSLACVQYNNSNKSQNKLPVKNNSTLVTTNQNSTTPTNFVKTLNDNAYNQTLNQPGIANPVGNKWTKTSALNYFSNVLNNQIKVFGMTDILKWVLIQNFDYQINQLTQTFANNSNFYLTIKNFNYAVHPVKQSINLAQYTCNIVFNVDVLLTNKNNNSATLSFSNEYTYNNVSIAAMIQNISNNGYSFLSLSNNDNKTLIPSSASYFNGVNASSSWSNADFTNLIDEGYLPTNGNTDITVNNYSTVLAANGARALNDYKNNPTSLNRNQTIIINPISSSLLYTFNIGLKFDDLNDLMIKPLTTATSSDGNMYNYGYNTKVSLGIDSLLSTINASNDQGLKYTWQYCEIKTIDWQNDPSVSADTATLTFNANQSYMYRLVVTKAGGQQLTSNTIIVNVVGNNLNIISNNTANKNNTYTYTYGTKVTLSITTKEWLDSSLGLIYTWQSFDNANGKWNTVASSDTSTTYTFNLLQSDTYRLIITQKNNPDFSLISNTVLINVNDNSLNITSNASQPMAITYGDNVTFSITNQIWQNNPNVKYQWYKISDGTTSKIDGANSDTYSTAVTASANYYLVITDPSISGFELTSNSIQVGTVDNTLAIAIQGQSVNSSNIYSLTYFSKVNLVISSHYWSDVNNPDLVYTWYEFDNTKNQYEPVTNQTTNLNYYQFNLISSGIYQLKITNKNNPNFLLQSNTIQINVNDKYVQIAPTGDLTLTGNSITPNYGNSVTLQVSAPSMWANDSSLTYQWYKIGNGQTTPTKIDKANQPSYTFEANGKNTYYLTITNPDGFSLTSNKILVDAQIPPVTISVKDQTSATSTYSFTYGTSVTLQVNKDTFWTTTNQSFSCQWQYYDPTTNSFKNVSSNGNSLTYSFNCFNSTSYKLIITFNGKQIPSNLININVLDSNLQIGIQGQTASSTNTYDEIYGNTATLDIVNQAWANPSSEFNLTYIWQKYDAKTSSWTDVGTSQNTYTTAPLLTPGIYRLKITDSSIAGFDLAPSASLTINVINNTLAVNPTSIQGESSVSVASNNTYQITYGSYTTLGINSNNFWNNPSSEANASSNLSYQWCQYDATTNKFVPISGATKATYSFYASANSQYELVITNSNISGFSLTSNAIIVNIINQSVSVNLTVPNTTIKATKNGSYNVTYGASPTLALTGYWANQTTFTYLVYQWYKLDTITNTWQPIQNATQMNLQLTNLETSGAYKLVISAKKDANANDEQYVDFSLTSNDVIINVINNSLQIGLQDTSLSTNNTYNVNYGSKLTFDIVTQYYQDSTNLTYQWSMYDPTKDSFEPITTNGTNKTYQLYAFQSGQYELTIANTKLGFSLTSNAININVNNDYVNIVATNGTTTAPTTVVSSYNVPYATSTTLSIISTSYWYTNNTDLSYQWYSVNSSGAASIIGGATSATYQFNPTISGSYELVITNSNIPGFKLTSNMITINVIDSNIAIGVNNQEVNNYSTNFGKQVTLSLLSDYWTNNQDATFQWYYLDNGNWTKVPVPTTGATTANDGTGPNYTFNAKVSNSYELKVTYTFDGKTYPALTSNSINVSVSDNVLMITSNMNETTSNKQAGVFNVSYGNQITFMIETPYWQTMTTGVTYQWEISTDNGNSYTPISTTTSQDATKASYTATIFSNVAYRLMLSVNGQTLISNQMFVNVINDTTTIATTTGSNDVNYGSSVTLTPNSYWVTNESKYTFTWYNVANPSKAVFVGKGTATYTFTCFSNQTYYLEITSTSNEIGFGTITSNNLKIVVQNQTSTINVQGQSMSTSNSYNVRYGSNFTLQLDPSAYWGTMVNKDPSAYTFQWLKWNGSEYVAVDSSTTNSTTPSTTNGLAKTYTAIAIGNGQYELELFNNSIPGFNLVVSNPITINVTDASVQIAYKKASSTQIASSYNVDCGTEITLDIPTTSYWATASSTTYTYTWQIWDAASSKFVAAPTSIATPISAYSYSSYMLLTSKMYRLEISEPSNANFVPIYSNNITFNPINTTLTIAPSSMNTTPTGNSYNVVYGTTNYSLAINTSYWKTYSGLTYQWAQWDSKENKFVPITTNGTSDTYNPSTIMSGVYQLTISDSTIGLTLASNELTINIVDNSYLIAPTKNAQTNVNTYSVTLGDTITLGISNSSFWYNNSGNTYQWEYLYNGTWYTIQEMESKMSGWNASYDATTNNGTNATYTITVNDQTEGTYKLVLSSTGTYSFSNFDSSNNLYVSVINTKLPITANNQTISSTGTYTFNYGTSVTLSIEQGNYYATATGWTYQWLYFNGEKFAPISGATKATYQFNGLVSNAYELQITNASGSTLTSSPLNVDIINDNVTISAKAPYATNPSWSTNAAYVPYTSPLELQLDSSSYWYKQLGTSGLVYTVYNEDNNVAIWTSSTGSTLTLNNITSSGTYKLVITNPNITETLPDGSTADFMVTSNLIAVAVNETTVSVEGWCAQNVENATTTPTTGIANITYFGTANISIKMGDYWATQVSNSDYSYQIWNQTTDKEVTGLATPTTQNGMVTFAVPYVTTQLSLQLRIYKTGTQDYIASNVLQFTNVNNSILTVLNNQNSNLTDRDLPGATYNEQTATWSIAMYDQGSTGRINCTNILNTLNWVFDTTYDGQSIQIVLTFYQFNSSTNSWDTVESYPIQTPSANFYSWDNGANLNIPAYSTNDSLSGRYKVTVSLSYGNNYSQDSYFGTTNSLIPNFLISTPNTVVEVENQAFNWNISSGAKEISATTYSCDPNTPLDFESQFTTYFLANYENMGNMGGVMSLQEDLDSTWTTIYSDYDRWASSYTNNGYYSQYQSNSFGNGYSQPMILWNVVNTSTWRLMWIYISPLNGGQNSTSSGTVFYSSSITVIVNTPTIPVQINDAITGTTQNSIDNIYFLNPNDHYNFIINLANSNIDFEGTSVYTGQTTPYENPGYAYIATFEWQYANIQTNGTLGTWNTLYSFTDSWYTASGTTIQEEYQNVYNNLQDNTPYSLPTLSYDGVTPTSTAIYRLTVLIANTAPMQWWGQQSVTLPSGQGFNYTVPYDTVQPITVVTEFVVVPSTSILKTSSSTTKKTTTAVQDYLH